MAEIDKSTLNGAMVSRGPLSKTSKVWSLQAIHHRHSNEPSLLLMLGCRIIEGKTKSGDTIQFAGKFYYIKPFVKHGVHQPDGVDEMRRRFVPHYCKFLLYTYHLLKDVAITVNESSNLDRHWKRPKRDSNISKPMNIDVDDEASSHALSMLNFVKKLEDEVLDVEDDKEANDQFRALIYLPLFQLQWVLRQNVLVMWRSAAYDKARLSSSKKLSKGILERQFKKTNTRLEDAQAKESEEFSKIQSIMDALECIEKKLVDLKEQRTNFESLYREAKRRSSVVRDDVPRNTISEDDVDTDEVYYVSFFTSLSGTASAFEKYIGSNCDGVRIFVINGILKEVSINCTQGYWSFLLRTRLRWLLGHIFYLLLVEHNRPLCQSSGGNRSRHHKLTRIDFNAAMANDEVKEFFRRDTKEKIDVMKEQVRDRLYELFNDYKLRYGHTLQGTPGSPGSSFSRVSSSSSSSVGISMQYTDYKVTRTFTIEQEFSMYKTGGKEDHVKSELEKYLDEDVEMHRDKFDILNLWKINTQRFPILLKMARDLLAVQDSTVTSKFTFSTGGRVLDAFRSLLSPKIVQALVCTQNWIRKDSKPISIEEDLSELEVVEKCIMAIGGVRQSWLSCLGS
ncbi:putative AC transposase [Sesamum angolense]|uniref:AC transposase n=1 Tax=Sesamum angolense TaxID=2727404 RepID=A0AAE1W0N6_9LAMI|nr:putative AC transposase [Sesamum angolense]